jgi:proteasome lid subunit RPN8/RPN11
VQGLRREVPALSGPPLALAGCNDEARLRLARGILDEVYAHAAAAWPAECCGLLLGPRGQPLVDAVRRCRNAAGPGAFALDGEDLWFLAESLGSARPARLVYHSHADAPAELSAADVEGALLGLAAPAWPVGHLVIEVRAGRPRGAALYDFDPAAGRFVARARFAGAAAGSNAR